MDVACLVDRETEFGSLIYKTGTEITDKLNVEPSAVE